MASIPNPTLAAGLEALKQGNYQDAIAHLEGVCEMELDDSIVTEASQSLVQAYPKHGQPEKAIALCQHLREHPDPQIQEWAAKTETELITKYPVAAKSPADATGFTPLEDQASSPLKLSRKPNHTASSSSLLPVPYSPPDIPTLYTPRPRWRNCGRAQHWHPLKSPKMERLWLVAITVAIAFFWLLRLSVEFAMETINSILVELPWFQPFQLLYRDPTLALGITIAILFILSPWLMDGLLKQFHGLEPLSLTQLASRHPESAKVIQKVCRKRRLPLPSLKVLPTDATVALTYGNLPRTARIVVSQGLLDQLKDDEIANIYAGQLGHIINRDFMLMSLGVLIIQIPYTIYWQIPQWAEKLKELLLVKLPGARGWLSAILLGITGTVASLCYSIYWVLSLPLLWLSRARVYYSDRIAISITGNPNGLTRALLKIALGISEDIQISGQTSGLLESFDVLLPVGYQQAIVIGSFSPTTPFEDILKWDCTNPYRYWLIINSAHPLLGERLHLPKRYAHFLKLNPELDLPALIPASRNRAEFFSKLSNSYKALPLLQSTLIFGVIMGAALRGILWIIGKLSDLFDIWQLIWLHNANSFIDACILIAFSISVFLWINNYFPDLKPTNIGTDPDLGDYFATNATLPPDSRPVILSGKLLGRSGLRNWLGQDLILQTPTGLVRLNYCSYLGPLGNILPQPTRVSNLVNQNVIVTGWFRRGVNPWIDIETISIEDDKVIRSYYPIWITILATVAALSGAYLIFQVGA
ncbi:zinc metalloprotease HtpX [Moorena sp. SIO3I6]|uniref:zinc metalloprotease HtpX n=1 Tax=Moorena sp. SIO3I6 TaxID=2607831 RepID=UPI0013F9B095|nr:zinc metalloprotease HtpX [Moorena sp. SIO3I6]NEP24722.1 M48 family metalloprotease [Moorena sp. SIO3I6]